MHHHRFEGVVPALCLVMACAVAQGAGLRVVREKDEPLGRLLFGIALDSAKAEAVSALQFQLEFDARAYAVESVNAGSVAKEASKEVHMNPLRKGTIVVLVAGLNQNTIANGTVAQCCLKKLGGQGAPAQPVKLSKVTLSDPFGGRIAADVAHLPPAPQGGAAAPLPPPEPGASADREAAATQKRPHWLVPAVGGAVAALIVAVGFARQKRRTPRKRP